MKSGIHLFYWPKLVNRDQPMDTLNNISYTTTDELEACQLSNIFQSSLSEENSVIVPRNFNPTIILEYVNFVIFAQPNHFFRTSTFLRFIYIPNLQSFNIKIHTVLGSSLAFPILQISP